MELLEPLVSWLFEVSKNRLEEFHLKKLNKAQNKRKELSKVVDEWVEERAMALFTAWLLEHGEEILVLASEPRKQEEAPKPEEQSLALPVEKRPRRYPFWLTGERRFTSRRKAG